MIDFLSLLFYFLFAGLSFSAPKIASQGDVYPRLHTIELYVKESNNFLFINRDDVLMKCTFDIKMSKDKNGVEKIISYKRNPHIVSYADYLKYFDIYVDIESFRNDKNFDITFKICRKGRPHCGVTKIYLETITAKNRMTFRIVDGSPPIRKMRVFNDYNTEKKYLYIGVVLKSLE